MRTNLPSIFGEDAFDAAIGMSWDDTQSHNYPACLEGVIASELHHPVLLQARPMIEFDRNIADSRPDVSGRDALVLASARLQEAQTVLACLCLSSVGLEFETPDERDDAVAGVSVLEEPIDRMKVCVCVCVCVLIQHIFAVIFKSWGRPLQYTAYHGTTEVLNK